MPKITDYKRGKLSPNSIFLIDGAQGTSTITAKDVAIEMLKMLDSEQQVSNLKMDELPQITSLISTDKVLVGTEDGVKAMSAKNALFEVLDIDSCASVDMRKNIFRGNNLGDTFTDEQRKEIRDGTFRGLFIGDYWEKDGIKWRIVDIDYYYRQYKPDTSVDNTHHLILMPDISFDSLRIHSSEKSNVLYVNTDWYANSSSPTSAKNAILEKIHRIFDHQYVFERYVIYPKVYDATNKSIAGMTDLVLENLWIPTAEQVLGYSISDLGPLNINHSPVSCFMDIQQFSLFKLSKDFITSRSETNDAYNGNYILNSIVAIYNDGRTTYCGSSGLNVLSVYVNKQGVRPAFGITGGTE